MGTDPQLSSSCLEEILLPFNPSSSLPLAPSHRTSAAVAPHAMVSSVPCPGMASSKTAPSWACLGRGEEWAQSCLPRSHTLPAGPAAHGTFWWVFFHFTHKISFVVIRKCVSLKTNKQTKSSSFPSPHQQTMAISRCLEKNKKGQAYVLLLLINFPC